MKTIKNFLLLAALFAMPMAFAESKVVGNGPITLNINNNTDQQFVITGKDLKEEIAPIALTPKDQVSISGIGLGDKPYGRLILNGMNSINFSINKDNPETYVFNAYFYDICSLKMKEANPVEGSIAQLPATKFVIDLSINGQTYNDVTISTKAESVLKPQ